MNKKTIKKENRKEMVKHTLYDHSAGSPKTIPTICMLVASVLSHLVIRSQLCL